MKALQKEKIESFITRSGGELRWYDSLDDVPIDNDKFTIVVAHEFFDALPFHLLQVCLFASIFIFIYISFHAHCSLEM
jgi:NADH dehydrogenase [ubiquinone] 1 alpha subcomplex assembly factor 7